MIKLDKNKKDLLAYGAAYGSLFIGFGLLIAGFCVPPVGEISNSVLCAFGEILVFVGAVFGIALHVDNKVGIAKTQIRDELIEHFSDRRD